MKKKIILPFIVGLLFTVKAEGQWTDISVPTSQTLTHAAFTDDLRGYVSAQGYHTLWRTLDGGMSWDSTLFSSNVLDVDFSSDMNGAVLLQNGTAHTIEITNNGGNSWTAINFPNGPFNYFSGILTRDANTYFVMSYDFLLKTSDAGVNWDTVMFAGYPYSNDKEKIHPDTMFFTGWDGTFMYQGSITKTYDGGNTWTFLPTNHNYTSFDGTHFTNGYIGFGIYHSGWGPDTAYLSMTTNGGVNWNVLHYDTSVVYNDVFMKNQNEGYIALTEGTQGKIRSTTDGINWSDDLTTPFAINRLYHAQNSLYAVGINGQVFKKSVPLGILDNEILNVEFFPNPASEFIQLKNGEAMSFTMTDINGKIAMTKKIQPNERIHLEDFANGMYFLRLENGNEILQGKIILSK